MCTSAVWILERIGAIQHEVVINKSYLSCGRMRDQDIVCLSLLVSREHCEFAQTAEGLSVIDFASSNGVFINGHQIRPRQRCMLKEDDCVGIGCNNLDPDSLEETMFVYKVKRRALPNNRLNRKQQSRERQEPIPVPAKIQKVTSIEDDDDIKIIEPSESDPIFAKNKNINSFAKPAAKECQQVASSVQISNNIPSKIVVEECSSTSNIDNEKGESLKKSINIAEKNNLSRETKISNPRINEPRKVPDVIEIDISELVPRNIKVEPMQLDEVGTSSTNNTRQYVEIPRVESTSSIDDHSEVDITNSKFIKKELITDDVDNDSNKDCNGELNSVNEKDSNFSTNNEESQIGSYSQIDLVELDNDEDEIFPSSQLFNRSNSIKQEIEENADNEQMLSSAYLDDEDDNVITIIDSDEEEQNYLDGLLQKIKPEPAPACPEIIVPDILDSDFDKAGNYSDSNSHGVVSSSTRIEINNPSIVLTRIDVTHPTLVLTREPQVDTNNQEFSNNEEIDSSARVQSVSTVDEAMQTSKKQSLSSVDEASMPSTSKNVTLSPLAKPKKKGVEIIEPHFMKPKKKRRADEEKRLSLDSNFLSSRKDKKNKKHKSSSSSSKKSGHHSSSSSSSNHKSKEKSSSKANKSSSESTDKSNDSINESVSLSKKLEEAEKPKNRTTIVKAKISSKSRGDMLCESMQNLRPTPKAVAKKPASEPPTSVSAKNIQKPVPMVNPTCIIPRRQVPSGSVRSTITSTLPVKSSSTATTTDDAFEPSFESNPVTTSSTSRSDNTSTVLKNTTNFMNLTSCSTGNHVRASPSDTESIGNDFHTDSTGLKPSLTISANNGGNNKRVTFKENIVSVKEFEIVEGNSMRNIKDGSKTAKEIPRPLELKIEDFLARVFAWEPCWLEQQIKIKELPPIVDKSKLAPLPNTFNGFEQYYKKMEILLLLETWQLLLKEYECGGSKYTTSSILCCAIERDSIKQQLTPNRLRYSKLEIKTIVTKDQLNLKNTPVNGDMIILEYNVKVNGSVKWRRAFAYVIEVKQQNSLRSLPSAHPLFKTVNNPHAIITYSLQTRVIDEHTVQFEKLARLRGILYLRPHLRAIKGLQCVPRSALRDSILHVDIDEYKIDPEPPVDMNKYKLVTCDKLNTKQKEAVIKFTDAATQMKSKIGLLVGPPGTGKSKVITNLVTQMLYGDGRFVNGTAKRILVCAPSNAAIDEIVLRLLEIRGAITNREHRFRMVRIGREECMHDEVKKISVSDLARKEANRQYQGNKQKQMEDVEHKKQMLMKTIKSLTDLISTNPHGRKGYEMDLQCVRAKYEKLAYRSPEADQMERNKLEIAAKTVILQKAHVIACTLSSCFNGQMEAIFGGNTEHIATCIVDEATQCCEAETLIPLMLGVKNLFLVGDPNQLPATVMSTDAKRLGLDRSLFTRAKEALESQLDGSLNDSRDPVIMLKEQYRMVSAISYWPNKYFYKGRLIDQVAYKQSFPYYPYRILHVDGIQDSSKFSNTSEAVFVGNLVYALMMCDKIITFQGKITIGIITPYQNQRSVIKGKISEITSSIPADIKAKFETECNTIDSFQGQERDIIIISCVRSHGIGFLSDPQRLCVALTRAKQTLIICGNLVPFKKDKMWDDLLCDARKRGLIQNLNKNARPSDIKGHVIRSDIR